MKAAAKDGRIHLYFLDESGMSNIPAVQRSWSPPGRPHCADASLPRKYASVLGALNYGGNTLVHSEHPGSTTRDRVVAFIDQLAGMHGDGKPIIVVLDNASIHHGIDNDKSYYWLVDNNLLLFYLPTYSPELNPIEIVWKHAKYHWRKFASWTKETLLLEMNELFDAYGKEYTIDFA